MNVPVQVSPFVPHFSGLALSGIWDLFGIWVLEFGIFPWSLSPLSILLSPSGPELGFLDAVNN